MDISELSKYPISETFALANSQTLEPVWDANYFTRVNMRAFDKRREVLVEEARKPFQERIVALRERFAELEKEATKKKKPDALDDKMGPLIEEAEEIADQATEAVNLATRKAYAEEFATKVLISIDIMDKGQAVPLTTEALERMPLLFLQDLYAFCREESLPKAQRVARRMNRMTSLATNGGSLIQTTQEPTSQVM